MYVYTYIPNECRGYNPGRVGQGWRLRRLQGRGEAEGAALWHRQLVTAYE